MKKNKVPSDNYDLLKTVLKKYKEFEEYFDYDTLVAYMSRCGGGVARR